MFFKLHFWARTPDLLLKNRFRQIGTSNRRQRAKKRGTKHTLKTDAGYRDIDLHSSLAKMLSDFIGDRKEGFLFETRSGNMLSPESFDVQ